MKIKSFVKKPFPISKTGPDTKKAVFRLIGIIFPSSKVDLIFLSNFIIESTKMPFLVGTKILYKRRRSYHFKPYEFRNLQAFDYLNY